MKILSILKKILVITLTILLTNSCVTQEFEVPEITCTEPNLVVTNTIAQVKEMYAYGNAKLIEENVVIEGYVVSSDESGNMYKTISIQDKPENPTAAIKIAVDATNLYTKFNVGRKIFVNLKGLGIGYSFGSLQIGKISQNELTRISSFEIDTYIKRSCEVAEIIPKKVQISDLNPSMLEMLIELENVQFKQNEIENTYGNPNNTATVSRTLEQFDNSCKLIQEIKVRNSGFSSFKNEQLPTGKGSVVAIFSNYYDDYQLYLRNTNDVTFTVNRCDYSNAFEPTTTIAELINLYEGTTVEFGIENELVAVGYVISSDQDGNFENSIVLQDAIENPTAGIKILIQKSDPLFEKFNVGDKVYFIANQLYMAKTNNVLTVGYYSDKGIEGIEAEDLENYLFNTGENFEITPTDISIAETQNVTYENTLVRVQPVQLVANELGTAFAYYSGSENGIRTLETCNELTKLQVVTNGNATFANKQFPTGKGAIVGVLSNTLQVRYESDVQFNEVYETCPVILPKILITEIADPENNTSARFIELYNAGDFDTALTGWKLNKYINGATTVSGSGLDLSSITIPTKGFAIIANTGYAAIFNDQPNIESSYISGNGDDVYELVDATSTTHDIYGIIGEDGTGTGWEYLDGKAIRKSEIAIPNTSFDVTEWQIYSDASNTNITNPSTPQVAPQHFNPRSF